MKRSILSPMAMLVLIAAVLIPTGRHLVNDVVPNGPPSADPTGMMEDDIILSEETIFTPDTQPQISLEPKQQGTPQAQTPAAASSSAAEVSLSPSPLPKTERPSPVTPSPVTPNPVTPAPYTSQPTQKPSPAATSTPVQSETEGPLLSYAEQVVRLVNQERAKEGLHPLAISQPAQLAAQVRAKETEESFSHTRPDGASFSTALTEQGIKYRTAGENIAWGQKTPEQVMQGWMNSPGHRANIMNEKFTAIGVGYYRNASGVNYWTQLFIG